MSVLDLTVDDLRSSAVRTLATGGDGKRVVDGILTNEADDDNNLVGGILKILTKFNNWGNAVSGFLMGKIFGFGVWTFTGLMSQVQSAFTFIWNFNFNATDAEIDQQFAQFQSVLMGLLGGTIGNALGWLICGVAPGMFLMRFNKLLAVRVLDEVGEEAFDEVVANVRMLAMQVVQNYWRWEMMQKFKMARRAIKEMFKNPNGVLSKAYKQLGGDPAKVQQWGEKSGKPWSFALAKEAWIESIKDDGWQNFTEELIEEAFDACSEAFYVVAGAADQYMMERQLKSGSLLGQNEILEITPNRDYPEEKIVLAGPQELIKPVVVQTLVHHQILEERSIGNFMGETIEDVAKREIRTLMLRIVFSSNEKRKKDPTTVTLYNVVRSKLDWADIKTACGGANGYMWGAWRVEGVFNDETAIKIWAGSESEGVDRVTALSAFVEGDLKTLASYHELREGARRIYDSLYKQSRRQYPYEMIVINPVQILNEENGKATKKGIYKERQAIIPLWTDTRPDDWEEKLQDLFATPGPNG
jgi:hypothetical protein